MTDSATWATTSPRRKNRPAVPAVPERLPSSSTCRTVSAPAETAGTRPVNSPTANGGRGDHGRREGVQPHIRRVRKSCEGAIDREHLEDRCADRKAAGSAQDGRQQRLDRELSRATCSRPAPRATRVASSRRRSLARASVRLTTLIAPISSTTSAPAHSR